MSKTLGIVGGGQLGRMLADAARKIGVRVVVLDPMPNSPAGQVADEQIVGDFTDKQAVLALAEKCEVMTFEIESANTDALHELEGRGFSVHPTSKTLAIIKDKLKQKQHLEKTGIAVAPYFAVDSESDAQEAGKRFGYPFVLKSRSGGYDGRGNALVKSENDIPSALAKLSPAALYAEKFISFKKELAVVAVRTVQGEIATYQVVETVHEDHICRYVFMPAPAEEGAARAAEALAHRVLEVFDGAGVFGIEMFLDESGKVLVNEIAPRVHNSGHVTIETNETSQFEQHVRAVMGMSLGSTALKTPGVMINILGVRNGVAEPKGVEEAEAVPGVSVHLYGKLETRVQRKMGHLTAVADSLEEARANAELALSHITI